MVGVSFGWCGEREWKEADRTCACVLDLDRARGLHNGGGLTRAALYTHSLSRMHALALALSSILTHTFALIHTVPSLPLHQIFLLPLVLYQHSIFTLIHFRPQTSPSLTFVHLNSLASIFTFTSRSFPHSSSLSTRPSGRLSPLLYVIAPFHPSTPRSHSSFLILTCP